MTMLAPTEKMARTIATLVDFVGPLHPQDVARELGISVEEAVRHLCGLQRGGYVRYSLGQWSHFESTGQWNPDDDKPAVEGGASGPGGPHRMFGDERIAGFDWDAV